MIQLNGTNATEMRDILKQNRSDKLINPREITERMVKATIPQWLRSQILEMVQYREYDRCTCPIEQAMAQAVYNLIVKELMDAQKEEQMKNYK
jgi:hypothetical protein